MRASRFRPRTRPGEEPRARGRFLDAAEEVFGERGYGGATIRQIASRARLSAALIQYHFGGKTGLYEAMLERRLRDARQVFEGSEALLGSARGRPLTREVLFVAVRTILAEFLRLVSRNPAFQRVMQHEEAAGFPRARHVLARLSPLEPMADLIAQAQRDGIVRRDVPHWLIALLLFAIHQKLVTSRSLICERFKSDPMEPRNMASLMDMNLRIFFEGILPPPGAEASAPHRAKRKRMP